MKICSDLSRAEIETEKSASVASDVSFSLLRTSGVVLSSVNARIFF